MANGIIGSAFVRVRPDASGFETSASAGIIGPLKRIAAVAGGVFAAIKVKDFLSEAVSGYQEDVNEAYKTTRIFGQQAGQTITNFTKVAAQSFGLADDEAAHFSNSIGQLLVQMGIARKPAADMSVRMTKLAVDMASFANVPVEDAARALERGLAGATRGLKTFDIVIDQNQIKQEALRLGLTKHLKDALTPAMKAQASYALILQHSGIVSGDFERRSGNLRNTMMRLNAEWDVAKDAIGKNLLPAVITITNWFATILPGAIETTRVVMGRLLDTVKSLLEPFQPIAEAAIRGFGRDGIAGAVNEASAEITKLVPAFEPVQAAIATTTQVLEGWKKAWDFAGPIGVLDAIGGRTKILLDDFEALSSSGKLLATVLVGVGVALAAAFFPVTAIVVGLTALSGALVYAYKTNETFRTAVQAVGEFLSGPALQGVQHFAESVQRAFDQFGKSNFLKDLEQAARNVATVVGAVATVLVRAFGPATIAVIKQAFSGAISVITGFARVVQGMVNIVVGLLSGDWARAWLGVKQVVSGSLQAAVAIVRTFAANIITILGAAGHAAVAALSAGLKAATGAVKAGLGAAAAAAAGLAGDFLQRGEQLAQSLAAGIKTAPAKLKGLAGDLMGAVGAAISQAAAEAAGAAEGIGRAIGQGIISGIQGMAGAVKDAAVSMVHNAVSGIAGHLGIHSPSTVTRDQIGKPMAEGLLLGFLNGVRDLPAKMKAPLQNAIQAMANVIQEQRNTVVSSFQDVADKAFRAFDARTQAGLDKIAAHFDTLRKRADDSLAKASAKLTDALSADMKTIDDNLTASNKSIDKWASDQAKSIDDGLKASEDSVKSWADAQKQAVNDALKGTLAAIDAWQKQLTPAEAELAQETTAHDADEAAKQLADAQKAVADAQSKLNDAQAAGTDPQAILDAQKAVADAQAQLADVLFQQHISQLQDQAQQERAERDAEAQAQKDAAQAAAQAQLDAIDAQSQDRIAALEAAAAAERDAIQAQADAERALAQKAHDAAAADRQAQYDADQAALDKANARRHAAIDRDQKRQEIEYQADRDLLAEHLRKRLAQLEEYFATEKDAWQQHGGEVVKLFHSITGDYRTAGLELGRAFITGLNESIGELSGAAEELAREIARYLKLHSPAEKGPLSDLDTWWRPFAPTLMKGLDTSVLDPALRLSRPGGSSAPGARAYGTPGDPAMLRKLDELIGAVKEHRDGDLTLVAASNAGDILNQMTARIGA